ncbi:hypothetical protein KPC83_06630 [Collinsella sp. zg1085]|uniref:hypothetical protein n=1 Tax=Collinsella sp. zg1085 TaxID=2844380 RepID=UPI001C0BDC1B|nr:hypothetical protein [Collinsella sp. zg1085]QWT17504.1 hypothetical protein KPC83_06630 [Collinsella sp. zg1085]
MALLWWVVGDADSEGDIGHTNRQKVKTYLEKRNRALARDFFNLSWDERDMEGYDETMKDAVE